LKIHFVTSPFPSQIWKSVPSLVIYHSINTTKYRWSLRNFCSTSYINSQNIQYTEDRASWQAFMTHFITSSEAFHHFTIHKLMRNGISTLASILWLFDHGGNERSKQWSKAKTTWNKTLRNGIWLFLHLKDNISRVCIFPNQCLFYHY